MNDEIRQLIDDTINKNSLVKINDQLYLKKYQIEVLECYHIPYQQCSSVLDVLCLINEVLDNDEIEDYDLLEEVSKSLQEFHYYQYTNK